MTTIHTQIQENIHLLVIADGAESYENLADAFQNINVGLDSLTSSNNILALDSSVSREVEVALVADMKFANTVLGLAAANGNYGCPLCYTCKHRRYEFHKTVQCRDYSSVTASSLT